MGLKHLNNTIYDKKKPNKDKKNFFQRKFATIFKNIP